LKNDAKFKLKCRESAEAGKSRLAAAKFVKTRQSMTDYLQLGLLRIAEYLDMRKT